MSQYQLDAKEKAMKKMILSLLGCCIAVFGCQQSQEGDNGQPRRGLRLADERPRRRGPGKKGEQTGAPGLHRFGLVQLVQETGRGSLRQRRIRGLCQVELVLVELDFPAQKKLPDDLVKANDALKDKYKISGYPTLDRPQARRHGGLEQIGYMEGGPTAVIAKLEEAKKK